MNAQTHRRLRGSATLENGTLSFTLKDLAKFSHAWDVRPVDGKVT